MKNLKIALLLALSQNILAQVTQMVPLKSSEADYPETGVYFKDIENSFNSFEGTWLATDGNTVYTIVLLKVEQHYESYPSGRYDYYDWLVGKLFVTNPVQGLQYYSSLPGDDFDNYPIVNRGGVRSNAITMGFRDENNSCAFRFQFRLTKVPNQPMQLRYSHFRNEGFFNYSADEDSLCPDGPIPHYVPQGELIFTKQ